MAARAAPRGPAGRRDDRRAARARAAAARDPTRSSSTSPTSPRTTSRSRCGRSRPTSGCWRAASATSSTTARARGWASSSDGAGRMSHLIADLLEYSRTGRARGDAEAVDLDDGVGPRGRQPPARDRRRRRDRRARRAADRPRAPARDDLHVAEPDRQRAEVPARGRGAGRARHRAAGRRRPLGARDRRQRHRDRAALPRPRVRALPATAHRRGVPWHGDGPGHRQEDRRDQRRHRPGRVRPGRGRDVLRHAARGRRR